MVCTLGRQQGVWWGALTCATDRNRCQDRGQEPNNLILGGTGLIPDAAVDGAESTHVEERRPLPEYHCSMNGRRPLPACRSIALVAVISSRKL